jgi:5-formyltetrahydrofolate cyclo-ligase
MHDVLEKKKLRDEYLKKRRNLSLEYINECSVRITDVFKTSGFAGINNYMSYLDSDNEIPSGGMNSYILSLGKKLSVPFIDENNCIVPVSLDTDTNLIQGRFRIMVPLHPEKIPFDIIEAVLVPGIAFDSCGNRIGYGKGYYDEFLKGIRGIKIGCCYSWQVLETITCSEHDVPMDYLLTEKYIRKLQ